MATKFEDILKKAEKRTVKYPDFEFEVDGEIYAVPYPDAIQTLEFSALREEDMLAQLKVLFANSPNALSALGRSLKGKDSAVLQVVVEEMFSFWREFERSPGESAE